ncbi:MAG: hypothetical protein ACLUTU_09000 [Blautia faecis]
MMTCVELAVNFLSKAIAQTVQEGTDRNDGVCFEKYLGKEVDVTIEENMETAAVNGGEESNHEVMKERVNNG